MAVLPLYKKVLKDVNLSKLNQHFREEKIGKQVVNLPALKSKKLNEIIAADAKFLESLGIMDYSLNLVAESRQIVERMSGIHHSPAASTLSLSRNEVLS